MDLHEQFRRSALELGVPDDEVARFGQFLRFAIWTGSEPHGSPVGRRGGRPLHGDAERLLAGAGTLPFVASFDCAALPGIDDLALPKDGSLLFFLDHEEAVEADSAEDAQRFARVVHVPADSGAVSVDGGHDLFARVRPELPHWLGMDEQALSGYQQHQARDLPHRHELVALVGSLWPKGQQAEIRIGGYSGHTGGLSGKNVHATPEAGMAWENIKDRKAGTTPDEMMFAMEEELDRVMREWVPLAQFRADELHVGRFLVRHDDLAALRLDEVLTVTEFLE
ncbi:hypothetical protein GCM10011609_26070 [Lentzea pudingi]|uniref:DUF1963 domain-containing protein n=1 Tax=Lentzea pudingi TaxID=1789439 RepID=A0ABQ2HPT4_9PSEU|nr:DUF1963 domain-containing protein [Lentzea pudingi]GGM88109.1 hypothetical protein GCM10011609_26070 [Lentzea pudingi]